MPIRETFWNIPHWAELAQYALMVLTILVFTYGVFRRIRRWRQGRPERRTDRMGVRLGSVVVHAIGQVRTAQDAYAGIMHLAIFWGMVALLMGTVLATVDWDVTRLFFGFQFLTGGVYVVYELVLDVFGLLLLVGLAMALVRRYLLRPARLGNPPRPVLAWDDGYVLVMLVLIALSGYLVEGLRIAVVQPEWARWSPVGRMVAAWFMALGDPTNRTLHIALWSSHALIAFTFIASIPFTKLFHLIAAPANIFFRSLQPGGTLTVAPADREPGVKVWRDFTWKEILDFEACVRCGRCQDVCPAHASGLPLSPRDVMIKLDAHVWAHGNGRALAGDVITAEELWACTTCRACSQACPVFVDHLASIVDLRRSLLAQQKADARLMDTLGTVRRYGNSFGKSDRQRALWTQGLEPRIKDIRKEPAHTLWFVGDYASYSPTVLEVTRTTARVFRHAGMDFGLLYEAERNVGNDVRRVGEEGLYELLAMKNKAALDKCDYAEIVTTDPHTYNALKNEYGLTRPVYHYTEVLERLLGSGQLSPTTRLAHVVTYHDPCYLGRYNGVYDAPRRVLEAIGCRVVEMPRHRECGLCCGAGGGRIWMQETPGAKERPAESRVREAAAVPEVGILVVTCPKDLVMFQDALKTTGLEGKIVVKDLIELVDESMQGGAAQ